MSGPLYMTTVDATSQGFYKLTNDNATESTAAIGSDSVLHLARTYVAGILVIIGVLGNSVSILLLLCTKLKYQSCSHYVTATTVANSFCLIATCLKWATTLKVQLYHSAGWCQFVWFTEKTSIFLSVWCTVSFAIDRYINICWPVKASIWCSTFRAKSVIVSLVLVATVVYMNISLIIGVVSENGVDQCSTLPKYVTDMKALRTADLTVNVVIPFTVIFFCLCATARLACVTKRDDDGISDDSPLPVLTCALLLCFLLLRMPREILAIYSLYYVLRDETMPDHVAVDNGQFIADVMYLANLSTVFFLLLATHRGFRYFLQEVVWTPSKCSKAKRHLVEEADNEDGVALDHMA